MSATKPAGILAALIALIAWAALLLQFAATASATGSVLRALWILAGYFTILTNLLVAVVFTLFALRRSLPPSLVAGTMLAILLVGIVYGLLLHGTLELSGASVLANTLLHMVTPILVPIFWIAFTPKGRLTRRDPLLWAIFPVLYLAYALLRGASTAKYPYPFLDVLALGWPRTLVNAALIAVAFLLSSYIVVLIDNRLGARAQHPGTLVSNS